MTWWFDVCVCRERAVTDEFRWSECPIAAFKGLKVGDYGGRSLSALTSTVVSVNPQIDEGYALHQWKECLPQGVNGTAQFASLSSGSGGGGGGGALPLGQEKLEERRPMVGLKDGSMGMGEKPDYATVKGTITYIKHDTDPYYCACSQQNCNKKVVPSMNGDQFICEKCNITSDTVSKPSVSLFSIFLSFFRDWQLQLTNMLLAYACSASADTY